jgi:hypothetical protein
VKPDTERRVVEVAAFLKLFNDDDKALDQLKLLCKYDEDIFSPDPYINAWMMGRRSICTDVIRMLKIAYGRKNQNEKR